MTFRTDQTGKPADLDNPLGSYLGSFNIRHTAADAANSVVAAITNPSGSGKYLYLKTLAGQLTFDGTAAAASSCSYELIRYSGAVSNPSTGTTLTAVPRDTRGVVSAILAVNAQYKSGILTVTTPTIESLAFFRIPCSVTGTVVDVWRDFNRLAVAAEPLIIGPQQGLGIRLNTAAIIGLGFSGAFEWDERAS